MVSMSSLAGRFSRFLGNTAGTTAITFALSIVPLLLAAGAAVDYARYADAETKIQAALDSAALAVATSTTLPNAKRITAGNDTFTHNIDAAGLRAADIDVRFKLQSDSVTASAAFNMPAGFMQIAGIPLFDIAVSSQISMKQNKKIEMALALDYSGSMTEISGGKVKYVAMKEAAKKLIADLDVASPGKVKVGLVPFSHHVYVTLPEKFIAGRSGSGSWTGCTQDRPFPANLTDATPGAGDATKWGQPFAAIHKSDGCGGYAPNSLKVAPLTTDLASIGNQLDAMRPYAWTHIALGAEFAYHLLSPNAPFTEGAPYTDKSVSKFMVLLTDGRQTEPAFGPGVRSVTQGEDNLEAICTNMKQSGITVITIAFDLRDKDTRQRLSDCASDPSHDFYVAEDSNDVAAAFEDIKRQVAAQVYISK